MASSRNEARKGRGRRRALVVALGAVPLLLAAACGSSSNKESTAGTTAAASGEVELTGTVWTLTLGTQMPSLPAGVGVTAVFKDGTLSGNSGCNSYSTTYTLSSNKLTIKTPVAGTQMMCGSEAMTLEQQYLARLPKVASYQITGTQLTLLDSSNGPILTYSAVGPNAVVGTWDVVAYHSGNAITSVVGGAKLTAKFETGTVSGDTGCGTFTGPWTANATTIKIGALTAPTTACSTPELTTQQQAYLAALQEATTYAVVGNTLDLLRADGTYAVQLTKG